MRKILSLLVILSLLLSMAGCTGDTPKESTSGNTTGPASTDPSAAQPSETEPTAGTDSTIPDVTEPADTVPPETLPPVTDPSAPTSGVPAPSEPTTAPAIPDPTQPSVTEPTDPPVTRPSATKPTVTDPPATRPSVTEPIITTPPATRPPVTEPAATQPPATEPIVPRPQTPTKPVSAPCSHRYALSHTQAAGCTAAEIRTYTCKLCGSFYQEAVGDPLGHSYGDATCTSPAACSRCGITSGTALGHSYNLRARCIRCGEAEPGPILLTVNLRDSKGRALPNVTVSFFLGDSNRPAATDVTGSDGLAHATVDHLEAYQVVLSDLPANVTANSSYTFTSKQGNINLPVQPVLDPLDHSQADYQAGSSMADFTLTDTDGNLYTLYDLLEEKELVILDFWYCSCTPCKNEFPYFEEALDRYGNDISLLALNPLDSEDTILQLRQELGSTFPMLRDTVNLYKGFGVTAYPVTVFIDSDGTVLSVHRGAFSSQEQFLGQIEKYLK